MNITTNDTSQPTNLAHLNNPRVETTFTNKYNDILNLSVSNTNILPASIQIATHNIRGTLGHLSTQVAISSYMSPIENNKARIDILGFSHTGLTKKQSKHAFTYSQFNDFQPYFAAATDPSYQFSGVGFLVKSSFAKYINQSGHWNGRVLYIDLFLKGKTRLRIIQIYAPQCLSPYFDEDTKPMTTYIKNLLSPQSSSSVQFKYIIMGDFNSHMNTLLNNVERNILTKKEDRLLHSLLFNNGFTDVL